MSDHPSHSANTGPSRGREDHPTTELPPHPPPPPPAAEPETRAFAGFRTERRFSDNATQNAPLPATREEPRAWAATPYQGMPRVVESGDAPRRVYGNYGGPPVPADAGRPQPPMPPSRYPELSTSTLLRHVKPPPSEGWRRWLFRLSGQLINVGESPRTMRYNDLTVQVNRPLRGCYRIAMLSLKGGVGKTTITATLGATFASIRGDRVVAVDANPDRGTLSQKVPLETRPPFGTCCATPRASTATAMSAATPRRDPAGWKCLRQKVIRRCRRRSAPTTTRRRWRSSSGSTVWCSPTAAQGFCIPR